MPERPDAGLFSPDFKFQVPHALDTAWIPNYIIRTFILVKFGYKFWDGTCALLITKLIFYPLRQKNDVDMYSQCNAVT